MPLAWSGDAFEHRLQSANMSWWSQISIFPKRHLEDTRRIRELRRSVQRVHDAIDKAASEALARGDETEAHRLTASKHVETSWDEDEIQALKDHKLMRTALLLLIHIPHSELSHDTHPAFTMLTGEGRDRVTNAVRLRVLGIVAALVSSSLLTPLRGALVHLFFYLAHGTTDLVKRL
jgi:hypothetical protein